MLTIDQYWVEFFKSGFHKTCRFAQYLHMQNVDVGDCYYWVNDNDVYEYMKNKDGIS